MALDAQLHVADAADAGQPRRARGRRQRSGRRLAQQLRGAGARRASAERRGARADRAAPVQRHAAVEHGAELRGDGVSRHGHARSPSGGQDARRRTGPSKASPPRPALGLATRRQARARAGRHRRLRHAGGHANGVAARERQDASPPRPSKCPQAGAPPSSSLRSTCPTASAAAKSASIPATPSRTTTATCFAVERSDPQRVLFVHAADRYALAAVFRRRAGLGGRVGVRPAVGRRSSRRPTSRLSKYGFVVLSNLSRSAGIVRERSAANMSGTAAACWWRSAPPPPAAAACRSSARRFSECTTTRANRPAVAISSDRWATPIRRIASVGKTGSLSGVKFYYAVRRRPGRRPRRGAV